MELLWAEGDAGAWLARLLFRAVFLPCLKALCTQDGGGGLNATYPDSIVVLQGITTSIR